MISGFSLPARKIFTKGICESLGENISGDAAELPADVLPVRHRAGKRNQLALVENGQGKNQVIEMAAHGVTIIGEQNVAGLDVFLTPELDFRLDRVRQSADEHRQTQADGDRVAVGVEQSDGEILSFVNNRVVRSAHQVGLHLAGDRHHRAPNHLSGKRVYCLLTAPGIQDFIRSSHFHTFLFLHPSFPRKRESRFLLLAIQSHPTNPSTQDSSLRSIPISTPCSTFLVVSLA